MAPGPFPSPGLQALILCGPGLSLTPFTSHPSTLPKALLPLANRPLLWYPLTWLLRAGITHITIITPPEAADAITAALKTHPALTELRVKPEVLAPKGLGMEMGTAGVLGLEEVRSAVKGDFVVVGCDFVCEVEGKALVQEWQRRNFLLASGGGRKGGLGMFYPVEGKKGETDFLATVAEQAGRAGNGVGSGVERVVACMPSDTLKDRVEEDGGVLRVRQRLMQRFGQVKLRTRHRDAHVYFLPHWVMEFVRRNPGFESLSEDVLGWWVKAGWQGPELVEKLALNEVLGAADHRSTAAVDGEYDGQESQGTENARPTASALSSTNASIHPQTHHQGQQAPSIPPFLAYIPPSSPTSPNMPLILRVDTTPALLRTTLSLAALPPNTPTNPLAHQHKIHPSATLAPQTRISPDDTLIAPNVLIASRANLKNCVIGANSSIGGDVRLTGCLVMEGVTIGEGVVMTGCVIGKGAKVEGGGKGKGTKLVECEVAPLFVVEAGTEGKGEKFMAFETGEMDGEGDEDAENDEESEEEEEDEE
ncbi:hypothetical protein B0A50_05630 [Salinomyces thailandicus]|uniref:Mannose-1-phosphate guanyltransferase n=1 Tax=Salinomyces thailandicus TaxID=706561 RepID=A0A4U0TVL2_9PEZI|nr:hypothetical protein B0A50_05630 [Salinomyces thailandica]